MLEDTLVIWGGEFGRTVYCQGKLSETNYGRDPPSAVLHDVDGRREASGPGLRMGGPTTTATTWVEDPVHVYDLQATALHCLGIDHRRLTFKYQGRHFRLTDVHGEVVEPLLA